MYSYVPYIYGHVDNDNDSLLFNPYSTQYISIDASAY